MDIDANNRTAEEILKRPVQLEVPEYQRRYAWQKDQWETFYEDVQRIDPDETHFLGSIVVIELDTDPLEPNVLQIVDGQQRLTTISLLLVVIRERCEQEGISSIANKIDQYLWVQDVEDADDRRQKLTLGRFDNDAWKELVSGDLPQKQTQLLEAAKFFSNRISHLDRDELNKLYRKILRALEIVVIQCDSEESAFRLFETLNNRGKALSSVDLMKNHLFKKGSRQPSINYRKIREDWESVIETIQGSVNPPRRFFIHFMLSAQTPAITGSITRHTLYKDFKQVIDERLPTENTSVEDYISKMANTAPLYVNIVNSDISRYDPEVNRKINKILDDLDRVGMTQERPLILAAFNHLNDPDDIIRILRIIETFVVRRRITDSITGSDVYEFYARVCTEAFGKNASGGNPIEYVTRQLRDETPDDDVFVTSMKATDFKKSDRTKYFLAKFESHCYRNGNSSVDPSDDEIEHVAPRQSYTAQKYSTWPDYLGVSEETFEEYKNKLGNLTLLTSRLNAEAQDDPFEQKKAPYRRSEYNMNDEIADRQEWSTEVIEERTNRLAEAAQNIWNYDY